MDLGGNLRIANGGAISLTCRGGGTAGLSSSSNHGIVLNSALTLGSSTTASATLIGTGGEGTGGSHYGIYVQTGSATLNGASTLTLSGTGGGVGGTNAGNNIGILYAASYAPSSSSASLLFGNCTGGGFATDTSTGNYGVQINSGLDVAAIQMASGAAILGGATQGSGNHGLYISGSSSFIGSATRADIINLTASAQATGGTSQGILLESGGAIKTIGAGAITLSGTGGGGSVGSANYGVYVTGTGSAISAQTGPISITGAIADTGTTQAILISSSGAASSTTGNIDLYSTSPKSIAFDSSSSVSSTSGNLSFHGPTILLGGPISLTTTGAIHFYSTLDGAFDVTLASSGSPSSAINFDGAIGGSAALASLTAYGSSITQSSSATATGALNYTGVISLNGNQTTSGGAISMNGAVTLQQNIAVASGGGPVSYSSSINGASNGGSSLQITAGSGTVSFGAAIGATHYLSGLSLVSAATTANAVSIGGNISANSFSIATASPALLTNSSIIDTSTGPGNISFPSTIDGTFDLTLTAGSGSVALLGSLGNTASLDNVSITSGAASLTLGASSITAASLTVGGSVPTVLNTSLSIATSGVVSFGGTINGASTYMESLTINASGSVALAGNLGDLKSLNNIDVAAGALSLTLGGTTINATTFTVGSAVPTALNANLSIGTTANISFGGTVNGDVSLDIVAGTTAAFGDDIGALQALSTLSVAATAIYPPANTYAQGGTLTYNGPVVLTAPTLFSDTGTTGIFFEDTITGPYDLILSAINGAITVQGAINVSTVSAHCGQNGEFDSSIDATGDVSIQSDHASVIVGAITATSGDITLQPASGFSSGALINFPDGILVLNGNLSAVGKTISLSPAGRTELLSVATITGPHSGGNVTLSADQINIGGTLLTDQFNESFTVLGTLTIHATTSAIVADLIAQNSIVVNAPVINIFKHLSGQIYDFAGDLYTSMQTNILSTATPSLVGTQIPFGSGADPSIAQVSRTPSEFGAALVYSGNLLNYDLTAPLPPTPTPSGNSDRRGNALEKFGLSVSELFYKLPIEWITQRTASQSQILER